MNLRDALELLLLASIWGASFLFMRIAGHAFGPAPLVLSRVAVAALALLPLLLLREGLRPTWRHRTALLVAGVFNSALPFCLIAYASLSLTAGFGSLLNAVTPLMVALVGWIGFGHRPAARHWVGFALAFAGVVVLSWGRMSFQPGGSGWAIVAALGATLSYGIGTNYSRRHLAALPPLGASAGTMFGATVAMLPLGAWLWPSVPPGPGAWGAALALGVVCTGVAYLLFFRLIASIGPNQAASVTFLVPLFAMLWGALFLHEPVTARMIVASVIILAGTAWANRRPHDGGQPEAGPEVVVAEPRSARFRSAGG